MKFSYKYIVLLFLLVALQSCQTTKKTSSVHGDKPLIDTSKIIIEGQKDMDKKVREGPKPFDTSQIPKEEKRKTITTISPSLTSNLVLISFVEIPGSSAPSIVLGESLFTWISNKTFPSPIILGVTVNANAASLNSVVVVPSDVVW